MDTGKKKLHGPIGRIHNQIKSRVDTGKKKLAVLVGCNYPNTRFKLDGCINDVLAMGGVLEKNFGFDPSNVELLTDVPVPGSSELKPTGANIKAALKKMVSKAEAGDVLFFHFSGHGTKIPVLEPGQPFREDEAIVPCDLNLITDVDFRYLANLVPKGATFTILSDSCHSGGLIDKEKEQIGPSTIEDKSKTKLVYQRAKFLHFGFIQDVIKTAAGVAHEVAGVAHQAAGVAHVVADTADTIAGFADTVSNMANNMSGTYKKDVSLKFHPQHVRDLLSLKALKKDEGILLSGCQANETSADVVVMGKAHGAFSFAVLQVLTGSYPDALSNRELVTKARKVLREQEFEQHPCLYCSDENADATFLGAPTPWPEAETVSPC